MRMSKRNRLFIGLAVLLLLVLAFAVPAIVSEIDDRNEMRAASRSLKQLSEICLQRYPATTASEKFKSLRHCIYVNSVFNVNKGNSKLWEDHDKMADWTLDYAEKERSVPPPMECSYRSGTLVTMLRALGYDARDIVITQDEDNFPDHVVISVFNPETQKWEVHDASYDVEFLSLEDRKPLGIKRMLRFGTDKFEPCNFEGKCGWNQKTSEDFDLQFNRKYWNVAWIKAKNTMYVSNHFDVNKKRMVKGEEMSYCEFRKKWCKNVVPVE